jgi:hypothetical protein
MAWYSVKKSTGTILLYFTLLYFTPRHRCVQTGSGASGYWGLLPGEKSDRGVKLTAGVKNAGSYNSTPQYVFVGLCLVKHRDKFNFTLRFHGGEDSSRVLLDYDAV